MVDNFRSTATKGTNQTNKYFYDKNYYNELRQYKTTFFDPNKRKYTNQNELIGPQYHDHFFSEYYLYLDERNKTEHYYNKFGKRYTFENPIAKVTEGRLWCGKGEKKGARKDGRGNDNDHVEIFCIRL